MPGPCAECVAAAAGAGAGALPRVVLISSPAPSQSTALPRRPSNPQPLRSFALLIQITSPSLQADYFPFLTDPTNLRNRTTFYHTLARLLFMEDTPAKFKSFVAPLQQVGGCMGGMVGGG